METATKTEGFRNSRILLGLATKVYLLGPHMIAGIFKNNLVNSFHLSIEQRIITEVLTEMITAAILLNVRAIVTTIETVGTATVTATATADSALHRLRIQTMIIVRRPPQSRGYPSLTSGARAWRRTTAIKNLSGFRKRPNLGIYQSVARIEGMTTTMMMNHVRYSLPRKVSVEFV